MRIALVGDVVGSAGRRVLRKGLKRLREEHRPDLVIVNGENAAVKPNEKTDIEVYVKPAPLVGFRVTSAKYEDGSNNEADFGEKQCPDSIKP